ncbi:MAG: hypothetical protein IKB71_01970 [Lentisphaeria bacterium]|nr:hypothetical protein [Lentisphaeria bacterium]
MNIPLKRIVNILFAVFATAVLLGILYAARQVIRRIALEQAAFQISEKFFKDIQYTVDYKKRQVIFAENEVEFLRKHKLKGKVIFDCPVKFFELPWRVNTARITVEGVRWELDLKNRKLNGFDRDEFPASVRSELDRFKNAANGKYPAFMTVGTLTLINPEGKSRELAMRSIFQELRDKTYLLGIHAGDMKVNFFYRDDSKKIIGQYQAQQSDFEFIRLSFGIPELFDMHGVGKLSGQFCYDTKLQKLDYVRGSSDFGLQASIKGSIFTLYGNRSGKINWEYLNPQNWQIELRNATSMTPVRAGLHYFVLSQNTLEKDALSFDGEIEFNPLSFKEMFGLELDRRTANIRHRIVGKWDMAKKSWELSRLETQKRVPQVKFKWNNAEVAFQWQNFKLSGRGAQADHFGFHYELDMSNLDWKDKTGNTVIGTQSKLEGDCILSLSDDTLKPVSTGKISCAVADGAFGKSRFLVSNAFLNFAPDGNGRTRYHFACGNLKVGIPDLQKGVVFSSPRFEGSVSSRKIAMESPALSVRYRDDFLLSGGKWFVVRNENEKNIRFELPDLSGSWRNKKLTAGKISGSIVSDGKLLYIDSRSGRINYADDTFTSDSLNCLLEGEFPTAGNFICRRLTLKPEVWKIRNHWFSAEAPRGALSMTFNENQLWHNRTFEADKIKVDYQGSEYVIPQIIAGELNNGKYCDGLIKNTVLPYRFDITYTRKNSDIILKNGRITFNGNILWGLTGDIKLQDEDDFLNAKLQYAEYKPVGIAWENGTLGLHGRVSSGFEVTDFSGTVSENMAKVRFVKRDKNGISEFEVKNFPAKYVEHTLGLPANSFNGMFEGTVTANGGAVLNPFKIRTFYLKNNHVLRMRLGALEKYAGKGNSVEDDFACAALRDFFAKTLTLDYHGVGNYMVLNVNTLGKSTDLLPYEYDVKEKKLKKSDVSLFNAEVEVSMKYMMKKP